MKVGKFLLALIWALFFMVENCCAMQFSQPVKVGRFYTEIDHPTGFYMEGETSNNGTRATRYAKYTRNYGWEKGVAVFGSGDDALHIHYGYDSEGMLKCGGENISNTVGIAVGHTGTIKKILTNKGVTLYSVRFAYCTSHLTIIGKRNDGKWIKYIDSKEISKTYFGGKDGYKEDNGVIYDNPTCNGDTIIIKYYRWHWKGMSEAEGEIRLKWDDKAQWFGIDKVTY